MDQLRRVAILHGPHTQRNVIPVKRNGCVCFIQIPNVPNEEDDILTECIANCFTVSRELGGNPTIEDCRACCTDCINTLDDKSLCRESCVLGKGGAGGLLEDLLSILRIVTPFGKNAQYRNEGSMQLIFILYDIGDPNNIACLINRSFPDAISSEQPVTLSIEVFGQLNTSVGILTIRKEGNRLLTSRQACTLDVAGFDTIFYAKTTTGSVPRMRLVLRVAGNIIATSETISLDFFSGLPDFPVQQDIICAAAIPIVEGFVWEWGISRNVNTAIDFNQLRC